MKEFLKKIPILGKILTYLYNRIVISLLISRGSQHYWDQRYKKGGNSGPGSYNKLAEFKAEVINDFVKTNNIFSILEFGCGDGNQLSLANYPSYLGVDVSEQAIEICERKYQDDTSKKFSLLDKTKAEKAQLTLSLDVIYHLLEDLVFDDYMSRLFDSSEAYVIIYSSNKDEPATYHVRHRKFSDWIEQMRPEWKLNRHIPNKYPYRGNQNYDEGSFSDFYIYQKNQ